MKPDFVSIDKVVIAYSVLGSTHKWLREAGAKSREAFVLWAGRFVGPRCFAAVTAIYPEQLGTAEKDGLRVQVCGDELHRISVWLYEHDQTLVAQVHSHPGAAFHSDVDDRYPIVTAAGQFSIVVPDYGRVQPYPANCAVYRLDSGGRWNRLLQRQISQIFEVNSDGPR